jgi:hypothetical protein
MAMGVYETLRADAPVFSGISSALCIRHCSTNLLRSWTVPRVESYDLIATGRENLISLRILSGIMGTIIELNDGEDFKIL